MFLAAVSAVARLVMYLAVCLSTLVLRRRRPNEEMGPALFVIPLGPVVPVLATVVAGGILFGATAQQLAAGGAALVAGAVLFAHGAASLTAAVNMGMVQRARPAAWSRIRHRWPAAVVA